MLYGNIRITAVEQDVVDRAVRQVVDYIPQRIAYSISWRGSGWVERFTGTPRQLTALALPVALAPALDTFDAVWSRFMTDQVFVMALPNETLRLGRDIPALLASEPYFDKALRHLDADVSDGDETIRKEMRSLDELVRSLDRTRGDGRGSAARDWRRYDERMNWAITLLRSRQFDVTLFWCPYSQEDTRRIVRGRLPLRTGDPTELEVQAPLDAAEWQEARRTFIRTFTAGGDQ
jgi:hypothetical protein